jgi:predicted transcriptional regulator of viral defense system
MPGQAYSAVFEVAADQHGYFTTEQVVDAGVRRMALVMMERRGVVERVSRGVYRLCHFPPSFFSEFVEAVLWPVGAEGVISHHSALALFGISDVNPDRIHITVPREHRMRRERPPRLVVHHADLASADRTHVEGIPVTTVERTLLDCHAVHVGNEILQQALEDARRKGLVSRTSAARVAEGLDLVVG